MTLPTNTILNRELRPNRPLSLLCFPYDGLFEYSLELSGYQVIRVDIESYNRNLVYNDFLKCPSSLPPYKDFDLVVTSNINQWQDAKSLSNKFHINHLHVEHSKLVSPVYDVGYSKIICTHEYLKSDWTTSEYLPYYVPDQNIKEEKNNILLVGDFSPNDKNFLDELKHYYGDNIQIRTNLDNPINSLNELFSLLKQAKLFFHLSTTISIPLLALWAASFNCVSILNHTDITSQMPFIVLKNPEDFKFIAKDYLNNDNKEILKAQHNYLSKYKKPWTIIREIANKTFLK